MYPGTTAGSKITAGPDNVPVTFMKLLGPFGKTKPTILLVFDVDGELKDISDLCCVQYPEPVEAEQNAKI